MKQYETGFVLSPAMSEEETSQFIGQAVDLIAQKKGRLVKQDIWGKRRLAFPIRRFTEGFYVFLTYEGEGDISAEMERRFKQSDLVIRFMTVKKDPRDMAQRKKNNKADEPAEAAPAEAAPAPAVAAEPAEEKK